MKVMGKCCIYKFTSQFGHPWLNILAPPLPWLITILLLQIWLMYPPDPLVKERQYMMRLLWNHSSVAYPIWSVLWLLSPHFVLCKELSFTGNRLPVISSMWGFVECLRHACYNHHKVMDIAVRVCHLYLSYLVCNHVKMWIHLYNIFILCWVYQIVLVMWLCK